MTKLVEMLGGNITYSNFLGFDKNAESIRVNGPRNFIIFLPSDTNPLRDRFTIAHELGHYLLHYPIVIQRHGPEAGMHARRYPDYTQADLERAEWEANWFAASLLMPATQFKAVFTARGGDITSVADAFEVTPAAAGTRAKALDLQ